MLGDHEPDAFEKGVRFGCGVLFAVPVGLHETWDVMGSLTLVWVAGVAGFALLIGWLAMILGDRFWLVFLRLFSHW